MSQKISVCEDGRTLSVVFEKKNNTDRVRPILLEYEDRLTSDAFTIDLLRCKKDDKRTKSK